MSSAISEQANLIETFCIVNNLSSKNSILSAYI